MLKRLKNPKQTMISIFGPSTKAEADAASADSVDRDSAPSTQAKAKSTKRADKNAPKPPTVAGSFRRFVNDTVNSLDGDTRQSVQSAIGASLMTQLSVDGNATDRVGAVLSSVTSTLSHEERLQVGKAAVKVGVPTALREITDPESALRRGGDKTGRVIAGQIFNGDSTLWNQLCRKNSLLRTGVRVAATTGSIALRSAAAEVPRQIANPDSISWRTAELISAEVTAQITQPDSALWCGVEDGCRLTYKTVDSGLTQLVRANPQSPTARPSPQL